MYYEANSKSFSTQESVREKCPALMEPSYHLCQVGGLQEDWVLYSYTGVNPNN